MTTKKPERKILEKSLNAEGIQGPLNQRSDFKDATQTMKRLYDEQIATTGDGTKPIPPGEQVRQRLDQPFEGLEEYDYRLDERPLALILMVRPFAHGILFLTFCGPSLVGIYAFSSSPSDLMTRLSQRG